MPGEGLRSMAICAHSRIAGRSSHRTAGKSKFLHGSLSSYSYRHAGAAGHDSHLPCATTHLAAMRNRGRPRATLPPDQTTPCHRLLGAQTCPCRSHAGCDISHLVGLSGILPSNSSYGGPAASGLGRGHGRPARLVCRKTGGTPVPPELPPRLLSARTRRARVQRLLITILQTRPTAVG
jgi:hypothetical protein